MPPATPKQTPKGYGHQTCRHLPAFWHLRGMEEGPWRCLLCHLRQRHWLRLSKQAENTMRVLHQRIYNSPLCSARTAVLKCFAQGSTRTILLDCGTEHNLGDDATRTGWFPSIHTQIDIKANTSRSKTCKIRPHCSSSRLPNFRFQMGRYKTVSKRKLCSKRFFFLLPSLFKLFFHYFSIHSKYKP